MHHGRKLQKGRGLDGQAHRGQYLEDLYLGFPQGGEIIEVSVALEWAYEREIWDTGRWEETTGGRSTQTEARKPRAHRGKCAARTPRVRNDGWIGVSERGRVSVRYREPCRASGLRKGSVSR